MEVNAEILELLPIAVAGASFIVGGLVSKLVAARFGSLGKYWPFALAIVGLGWIFGGRLVPAFADVLRHTGLSGLWAWVVALVILTFVTGFAFFVVMSPKKASDGADGGNAATGS